MPTWTAARTDARRRRPAAYSLLEVTVVLAVVALAAAIVLPRASAVGELAVDAAARRLADRLSDARARAVLGGRGVSVAPDAGLPADVRVAAVLVGGTPRDPARPLALGPDGDALPCRVELVDARGRRAAVLLPAGMAGAAVVAAPGASEPPG
jgi:prepilin-type N-terminal cleavage/methylation domain-containing protein